MGDAIGKPIACDTWISAPYGQQIAAAHGKLGPKMTNAPPYAVAAGAHSWPTQTVARSNRPKGL
jgi:hypothetical protein